MHVLGKSVSMPAPHTMAVDTLLNLDNQKLFSPWLVLGVRQAQGPSDISGGRRECKD